MRGHGAKDIGQQDLLRARLDAQIDMNNQLVKLGQLIRWEYLDSEISQVFSLSTGRPATRTRLIVGLMYLQHSHGLSDEAVVLGGYRIRIGSTSVVRFSCKHVRPSTQRH